MFVEKTTTLEEWKKVQAKNEQTVTLVVEACKTVPKLHILDEVMVDANIRK